MPTSDHQDRSDEQRAGREARFRAIVETVILVVFVTTITTACVMLASGAWELLSKMLHGG